MEGWAGQLALPQQELRLWWAGATRQAINRTSVSRIAVPGTSRAYLGKQKLGAGRHRDTHPHARLASFSCLHPPETGRFVLCLSCILVWLAQSAHCRFNPRATVRSPAFPLPVKRNQSLHPPRTCPLVSNFSPWGLESGTHINTHEARNCNAAHAQRGIITS